MVILIKFLVTLRGHSSLEAWKKAIFMKFLEVAIIIIDTKLVELNEYIHK